MTELLKQKIMTVPHWPKKGIMFRDITTLLRDSDGLATMTEMLYQRYKGIDIDYVAGIEARGFITGAILAHRLGVGFIPIRKKGKLPPKVISQKYDLEYGSDMIEVKDDAIKKGDKILLMDDLIATGGTALAACTLLSKIGASIIECSFIVDLPDVGGRKRLEERGFKVFTLVEFEGE